MAKYQVTIDGETLEVELVSDDGHRAKLKVDGVEYTVEARNVSAPTSAPFSGAPQQAPPPARPRPAPAPHGGEAGQVSAPLAGLVLEVRVKVGQTVAVGDVLARLEAMKMENDIKAHSPGTVSQILVSQGDEVQEGQALLMLEA